MAVWSHHVLRKVIKKAHLSPDLKLKQPRDLPAELCHCRTFTFYSMPITLFLHILTTGLGSYTGFVKRTCDDAPSPYPMFRNMTFILKRARNGVFSSYRKETNLLTWYFNQATISESPLWINSMENCLVRILASIRCSSTFIILQPLQF